MKALIQIAHPLERSCWHCAWSHFTNNNSLL